MTETIKVAREALTLCLERLEHHTTFGVLTHGDMAAMHNARSALIQLDEMENVINEERQIKAHDVQKRVDDSKLEVLNNPFDFPSKLRSPKSNPY
jgi:hypothetical protein